MKKQGVGILNRKKMPEEGRYYLTEKIIIVILCH